MNIFNVWLYGCAAAALVVYWKRDFISESIIESPDIERLPEEIVQKAIRIVFAAIVIGGPLTVAFIIFALLDEQLRKLRTALLKLLPTSVRQSVARRLQQSRTVIDYEAIFADGSDMTSVELFRPFLYNLWADLDEENCPKCTGMSGTRHLDSKHQLSGQRVCWFCLEYRQAGVDPDNHGEGPCPGCGLCTYTAVLATGSSPLCSACFGKPENVEPEPVNDNQVPCPSCGELEYKEVLALESKNCRTCLELRVVDARLRATVTNKIADDAQRRSDELHLRLK